MDITSSSTVRCALLAAQEERHRAEMTGLQVRIDELERRLGLNSGNSGKPAAKQCATRASTAVRSNGDRTSSTGGASGRVTGVNTSMATQRMKISRAERRIGRMCVSWAHGLLFWLWQKGWRGKTAAVVGTIALLVVSGVWGWSELSASANAKAEITAAAPKVTGAAGCCSPEGWPTVGKTTVRLSGVGPISANARDRFGDWIMSHGSYLECDSSDDGISYRCLTPQRLDVAQALLLNGAAHVTHAAPPPYRAAEEQARKMGRGP